MKIISGLEQKYADYKSKNTDPYGAEIIRYGEAWADLMESKLSTIEAVDMRSFMETYAKPTSHEADTDGITGFMYGAAVKGLAHFWEHGEALRIWHNLDTQIKDEGVKANASGGVLNPAILNVG